MRVEPYSVGSFLHVYNRGNRKQPIVHDDKDRWRFLEMLYFFNDQNSPPNTLQLIHDARLPFLERPNDWRERDPLVNILGYCLRDNHYHLIIEEINDGGVTKFMRRLGTGMTNYYNRKYDQVGSLFQGAYKAKTVQDDNQLQWLAIYVMLKNVLESHPKGYDTSSKNLSQSIEWALTYNFSSLPDYASDRNSKIIKRSLLGKLFPNKKTFIYAAKNQLEQEGLIQDHSLSFE